MATVLQPSVGVPPRRSGPRAARAIRRCLLSVGPIDRVLAIIDGTAADRDGLDAADQLARLVSLFGWGALDRHALESGGVRNVTAADAAAARHCGGTLRPVVFAQRDAPGVQAFVGHTFLSSSEPLATLERGLSGIHISGTYVSNLLVSGHDLGRDLTTGTGWLAATHARPIATKSPATPWFARVTFPGVVPPHTTVAGIVSGAGLNVERVADHADGHSRWLLIGTHGRTVIDAAAQRLGAMHRLEAAMFRRVSSVSIKSVESACARDN